MTAKRSRTVWVTIEVVIDSRIKDAMSDEYEEAVISQIYNNNWTLIGTEEYE